LSSRQSHCLSSGGWISGGFFTTRCVALLLPMSRRCCRHNKNVLLVFNSKSVSLRTEVSEVFNKFLCAHHPPNNHRHRHSSSLFSKLINLGRSENHSLQNSHERRHPGRFSARLEFPGDSVIELPRRGWRRTTRINSPPGWFLRFGSRRSNGK
jgi:hypothetical protein